MAKKVPFSYPLSPCASLRNAVARMLCLVAPCRKKQNFCAIYIYKCIILPRQAGDKHRENSKNAESNRLVECVCPSLSRACLGKMIVFDMKTGPKKTVWCLFLPRGRVRLGGCAESVRSRQKRATLRHARRATCHESPCPDLQAGRQANKRESSRN